MTLGVRAGDEEGFRKICGYLGDGGKPRYPRRLDDAPRGGQRSGNRARNDYRGAAHGSAVRLLVPKAKARKDYAGIPASGALVQLLAVLEKNPSRQLGE